MIVLVVMVHAAVTYSGIGSWYYVEKAELDVASTVAFVLFQTFTQAYFMGLLFFIAGYFLPGSLDRKGFSRLAADRAVRLGVPALVFMLVINPLTGFMLMRGAADPGAVGGAGVSPVSAYLRYISSGEVLAGTGPLWFAVALLAFSLVYGLARVLGVAHKPADTRPAFGNRHVAAMTILIAAASFLVRLVQPIGTSFYNMQLCFFPQYVVLFLFGTWSYYSGFMTAVDSAWGLRVLRLGLGVALPMWAVLMITGGALGGNMDSYMGGWHWQSAAYAAWEAWIGVTMTIGLIVYFRERLTGQNALVKAASASAFSVYVFHTPVLVAVSLLIQRWALHPLGKFLVASVLALVASFGLSHFVLRRVPLLKKVL